MSRAARLSAGVALVAVLFVGALAGSYGLTLWAISQSQHQWCASLEIITANAKPTTAQGRQFYDKLADLEHRFGCG